MDREKELNNQCKNCANTRGYRDIEGFYCVAKGLNVRCEFFGCNAFVPMCRNNKSAL